MDDNDNVIAVMEQVSDGVLVVDAVGTVQAANDHAATMLDQPVAELVGRPCQLPLACDRVVEVPIHTDSGELGVAEMRVGTLHRQDGGRQDGGRRGGPMKLVTLTDISDRLRVERLRAHLKDVDFVVSIGHVGASVSHAVNNVLGSLLANTLLLGDHVRTLNKLFDALEDRGEEHFGPEARASLDAILQEHDVPLVRQETAELVDECLDGVRRIERHTKLLSRRSRGMKLEIGPVELEDLVGAALVLAGKMVRTRARFVKDLESMPPVAADRARITQLLATLLFNAASATPANAIADHEIRLEARRAGNLAMISVRDTGRAVPPDDADDLVDERRALAFVRQIARSHGGELRWESPGSCGATFTLTLPLYHKA